MTRITSVEALRAIYPPPSERALKKQLDKLDRHCRSFIGLSPFVVISSVGADGLADASPRGDRPGFVQILDYHTIAVPDWPGNNRLDTLSNIIVRPSVGLLFLVPGVDETLRVNGEAELRDDEDLRSLFERSGKLPRLAILVHVKEAYLHCAKALMRSRLWDPTSRIERSLLPTMNEMLQDQIGAAGPIEPQEDMIERYRKVLY
ncbi:MAG TPA: pyridoxamine 5'-phosphate oxidase family protein [Hyphomicrobiaceae bacterium]